MESKIKKVYKLTSALLMAYLFNLIIVCKAACKEVNLSSFCYRFPKNSRCHDYNYDLSEVEQITKEIDLESLCNKFPHNSNCQQEPFQIMKIQLDRSGDNDEWIRLEQKNNTIEVIHTTRVKNRLVSEIINGGLEFSPIPIPIEINDYNWQDHQVKSVTFQPDSCPADICQITGINKLILPEGSNIFDGLLTVVYQEKELLRSISFRVPHDVEKETINRTITIIYPNIDSF